MLDVALKLVLEMTRDTSHGIWKLSDRQEHLLTLRTIASQLDDWERKLKLGQEGWLYTKKDAMWTSLYDYTIDFARFSVGIAFAMYTGVRIKLAWFRKQVTLEIIAQEPEPSWIQVRPRGTA